ncbi:MAG: O-antigen ligase family protein [Candidatus Gastranaerophilales bacterium]|nr:O-antigen ligase family protein [Candidatus Gastranaerophilales bacterium]
MKILNSKIFDGINNILYSVQEKTDKIRLNSLILRNINIFILSFILLTYVVSSFATTGIIGAVSLAVPVLVVLKVLITKGEKLQLEKCNFFILLYLLICVITSITSSLPEQSLHGLLKTMAYLGFYFALCQFLKNNKNYIKIILFIIASIAGIECIAGIMQNISGVQAIATWQDTSYVNPEDIISRVYGTLKPYNPNLLAGFLLAGISSFIAFFAINIKNRKFNSAIFSLICFLVCLFTLFLTGCRGAYISIFVLLVIIIIASYRLIYIDLNNNKLKRIWKWAVISICACFAIFLIINHGIFHRLMSIFLLRGDSSTSFRLNVYTSAVQMFKDNWLFGIGAGNQVFREIYGLYMLSGFDALSCYSVLLEIAVEGGVFALITYLMFILSILTDGFKNFIKKTNFNEKIIIITCAMSITIIMVHGIFDTIYFRPQVQYIFWTMAAILTVLTREEKVEE